MGQDGLRGTQIKLLGGWGSQGSEPFPSPSRLSTQQKEREDSSQLHCFPLAFCLPEEPGTGKLCVDRVPVLVWLPPPFNSPLCLGEAFTLGPAASAPPCWSSEIPIPPRRTALQFINHVHILPSTGEIVSTPSGQLKKLKLGKSKQLAPGLAASRWLSRASVQTVCVWPAPQSFHSNTLAPWPDCDFIKLSYNFFSIPFYILLLPTDFPSLVIKITFIY